MKDKIIEILCNHEWLVDMPWKIKQQVATEIESICYPKEFVEWMLYEPHVDIQLTDYYDNSIGEMKKEIKKYEEFYWKPLTLVELYEYWKQNIDK